MTYEEAKIRLLNESVVCGDYANEDYERLTDGDYFEYKHLLCEALNKQIEIEKAQFTHSNWRSKWDKPCDKKQGITGIRFTKEQTLADVYPTIAEGEAALKARNKG